MYCYVRFGLGLLSRRFPFAADIFFIKIFNLQNNAFLNCAYYFWNTYCLGRWCSWNDHEYHHGGVEVEGSPCPPPPPPPVQETGSSCQTRVSALPSSSIKMAAVSSCLSQPEKPATHGSSSFMAFNKLACSYWLILMIKATSFLIGQTEHQNKILL